MNPCVPESLFDRSTHGRPGVPVGGLRPPSEAAQEPAGYRSWQTRNLKQRRAGLEPRPLGDRRRHGCARTGGVQTAGKHETSSSARSRSGAEGPLGVTGVAWLRDPARSQTPQHSSWISPHVSRVIQLPAIFFSCLLWYYNRMQGVRLGATPGRHFPAGARSFPARLSQSQQRNRRKGIEA